MEAQRLKSEVIETFLVGKNLDRVYVTAMSGRVKVQTSKTVHAQVSFEVEPELSASARWFGLEIQEKSNSSVASI